MEKGLRFFIWGNWSDYGHLAYSEHLFIFRSFESI